MPYYRHGFETPFPASVVKFIGRDFDVDDFVAKIIADVDAYKEDCGDSLRQM